MSIAWHLCGYDKATRRLVEEHPVPARLLPTVRTLIAPLPDDHDLVLAYELAAGAVQTLAESLGVSIDPTARHWYFEGSDASEIGAQREAATNAH